MPVTYYRSPQHKYKVACAPPAEPTRPVAPPTEALVALPDTDKPWVPHRAEPIPAVSRPNLLIVGRDEVSRSRFDARRGMLLRNALHWLASTRPFRYDVVKQRFMVGKEVGSVGGAVRGILRRDGLRGAYRGFLLTFATHAAAREAAPVF